MSVRTLLVAVALAAVLVTACGPGTTGPEGIDDGWGPDPSPATHAEILAAPHAHDTDALVSALAEVAAQPDAAETSLLLALVDDEREEVRWHVAHALRAARGDEARAALERMAASDPSELVREEAAGL